VRKRAGSSSFMRIGGGGFVCTGEETVASTGAFRVWHTWANGAKKVVGAYLNIAHMYGYSYLVTGVSGF
jgi:hypothetical protein